MFKLQYVRTITTCVHGSSLLFIHYMATLIQYTHTHTHYILYVHVDRKRRHSAMGSLLFPTSHTFCLEVSDDPNGTFKYLRQRFRWTLMFLPVGRMMIPSTRRAQGQTTRILASVSTHSAKHDYTWLDRVFEGGVLPNRLIHVTVCDRCLAEYPVTVVFLNMPHAAIKNYL